VARIRPDLKDESVVEGLPSNEVVQILPLEDGRILLVCASERLMPPVRRGASPAVPR
jgi:hypothetical protein